MTRFTFAIATWFVRSGVRKVLGAVALCIALGFAVIHAFKLRKTGIETGGRAIWWDVLRPVHAALYLAAGLFALRDQRAPAAILLLIDTLVGAAAFATRRGSA